MAQGKQKPMMGSLGAAALDLQEAKTVKVCLSWTYDKSQLRSKDPAPRSLMSTSTLQKWPGR